MLAPELIRIQEKPLANWVTPAKVNAIRGEFMRQCDGLDGLADGIINNYMACRALFDVTQGARNRRPWAAKRCPNNVDPGFRATRAAAACLTDGQISTLEFTYARYALRRAARARCADLRHVGAQHRSLGQRPDPERALPGTGRRRRERADALASRRAGRDRVPDEGPVRNPLDYVEGGAFNDRRAGALGHPRRRPIPICPRFRSAAAR